MGERLDGDDAVGAELAATSGPVQIPENKRRVEVCAHIAYAEAELLDSTPRPVAHVHRLANRECTLCRFENFTTHCAPTMLDMPQLSRVVGS
ncbi:MAG TPA: hypothetical protein VFB62_18875, partial [Polyangiaceae bacterium]|nr:hypothetical protein [Polyangiaceae bacterium]